MDTRTHDMGSGCSNLTSLANSAEQIDLLGCEANRLRADKASAQSYHQVEREERSYAEIGGVGRMCHRRWLTSDTEANKSKRRPTWRYTAYPEVSYWTYVTDL